MANIGYVIDGQNRRVGKKVNGVLVEGFLYRSQLQPAAWVDGTGAVKATFVYGLHANVPEYMVQGTNTYRLITDQVGSVRLVVNTVTGAVVERIDWDEFGNVLADSAPGTQPFGFAGGVRDLDIGLTRFGARDYDPVTGRWTAKDPLRFGGGDTDLYAYCGNEPINCIDPTGLDWMDTPDWLYTAADFMAGYADIMTGIPFTSMSVTGLIRGVDGTDSVVNKCSTAYGAGMVTGVIYATALNEEGFRTGKEFKFKMGKRKLRIAPWGNRTDNPYGQAPHYHRNVPDPANPGGSVPGGSIDWHRPWQPNPRGFWGRF